VTYAYRLYGLVLNANEPISGLLSLGQYQSNPPDLSLEIGSRPPSWVRELRALPSVLRIGKSSEPGLPDASYTVTTFGADQGFELVYDDGTRFFIDRVGQCLWATWLPPLTLEDLSVYFRGPVMGLVLQRRRVTALHASAVSYQGYGIVLCGPSETGKSTTAAGLALRGFSVLSDDIAAIGFENEGVQIEPGYPRICLWPDAAKTLLGAADALPRLTPNWEKCFLPLDGTIAKFQKQKCPLGVIYVLTARANDACAPRIERISARQAVLELVQNTSMNWFLGRDQRAAELSVLSSLVTKVSIRRVVPHSDLCRIGALCDLIVKDATRLLSSHEDVTANFSIA
jgi:hypothetical protein